MLVFKCVPCYFRLHPYQWFCTWPRFKKEAKSNSELGYCPYPVVHQIICVYNRLLPPLVASNCHSTLSPTPSPLQYISRVQCQQPMEGSESLHIYHPLIKLFHRAFFDRALPAPGKEGCPANPSTDHLYSGHNMSKATQSDCLKFSNLQPPACKVDGKQISLS